MKLNDLLKLDVGFVHSVNYVSIYYVLNNINCGYFVLTDCDEREIPLEVTIYKILNGLPINVITTPVTIDEKVKWNIVKGSNELRNIIKWMEDDIPVTIHGIDASFKTFNENEIKHLLETGNKVISTIIRAENRYDGILSDEEIKEIVERYV